jgi:hypothetical protein
MVTVKMILEWKLSGLKRVLHIVGIQEMIKGVITNEMVSV